MHERLTNKHSYFCCLDGHSGFYQISIHPYDQEGNTPTYPGVTFAYRRMPFGFCNAHATFQRCMQSIFSDFNENSMEVFMNDFFVCGTSFDIYLSNLSKVMQRCKEVNHVLNWEKPYFMVCEGIVGHLVTKRGLRSTKQKWK